MTSTSSLSLRWLRSSEKKKQEEQEEEKKKAATEQNPVVDEDVAAVVADYSFIDRGKEAGLEPLQKLEFVYRIQRPNVCCVCDRRFTASPAPSLPPFLGQPATSLLYTSAARKRKRDEKEEEAETVAPDNSVVEFPARSLEILCSRHEQWLALNATEDDVEEFAEEMVERMKNGDFRKFRRICHPCFEAAIVSNVLNRASALVYENETLSVSCPVCPTSRQSFIRAERIMPFLSEQNRKTVRQALEKELMLRQNIVFHCPVSNCTHQELIPKKAPAFFATLAERLPKFVSCKDHGKHCTNCWNPIANDAKQHHCQALPKDVTKARMTSKIRRCTLCNAAIEKNGGCNSMTCRCGGHFDWDRAAVPKKSVMRLEEEEN